MAGDDREQSYMRQIKTAQYKIREKHDHRKLRAAEFLDSIHGFWPKIRIFASRIVETEKRPILGWTSIWKTALLFV